MKRRKFIRAVGVASASGLLGGCGPKADTPSRVDTPSPSAGTQAADVQASSVPDFARRMRSSDMHGLGEDGQLTVIPVWADDGCRGSQRGGTQ
jgi:hypothetical protein